METLITNDIKISVEALYRPEYSKPNNFKYIFSYEVTIQNLGVNTVQLLRRHWYILDTTGLLREVEGEGVIGEQPILKPGASHQYQSWCHLITDVGKMYGYYTMKVLEGEETFKALIPDFQLVAPFKMN